MNSSIESRQTHRPRPCNRLRMAGAALLAMLVAGGIMLGLGMSPSRASAQVAEDQLGATVEVNEQAITQMLAQLTESAPAHERLVRLSEFLGSRHPSQPGNARADEMVRRYFESLAAQDQTPDEQDALEADRARLADLDERIAAAVRTSHFPGPDLSAEEFASRAAEAQQQVNELSIEAAVLAHHIARTQADNWRSGRVSFPLAIFHPGQATLSGPTGSASMDQLAPNLVDPGNLPEEGFEGELLFVGGASPRELSEVDLAGKAVLMTFNSANRWVNAMELGARVVLILEPEGDPGASFSDAEQKSNLSPVTAPRFLVTREAIDAALGEDWLDGGEPASIRIDATPGRWLPRELNAHWLFIPGDAVPASAGSDDARFSRDPARQIVHIQTHLDANSVAPARSPGATGLAPDRHHRSDRRFPAGAPAATGAGLHRQRSLPGARGRDRAGLRRVWRSRGVHPRSQLARATPGSRTVHQRHLLPASHQRPNHRAGRRSASPGRGRGGQLRRADC